ncbi:MAG: TRAP transporter permease [Spirochaetaceae bacterium]|nr:TRAP transporter permease [Spirochaetaceae bacterium]
MSDDNQELTQKESEKIIAKFDRDYNVRQFSGIFNYIITALLILFAVYIFWVTLIGNLPEQVRRCAFVGILVFIGFLLYPIRRGKAMRINYIPWYDIALGSLGASAFFYYVVNFRAIIDRAVLLQPMDIYVGLIGMIILAELCRRVVGIPILVVAGSFVTYAFISGFSLRRVVHQLFYTTDGIIGTPIGVCSTFIVLFIFLAAFLEKSGIANFFIDLANSVAGSTTGGPAKVAVIASALLALITGSSVANTVSSGTVTIPTMKRIGYKPEFAAAVEASSSTGGQIMPPIMGAAAFLMAEMTGIPYPVIAVSALIPALLYFIGIFLAVHFEAKKLGLLGLPKEMIPGFRSLIIKKGLLFIPVVVLIVLMAIGYTPSYAACIAILASFVVSFFSKETRFTPSKLVGAFVSGSRNTLNVSIACAVAGTIVGIVSLTGIGQILVGRLMLIVNNSFFVASGTSLFFALLVTMVACLVLGMGVPTTANYVIMATITAPMVVRSGAELGIVVPILAAHMFVFYFGIAADITPPVALASYAGAAIAKANPVKTSVIATRLAITAFIVPYVFIFNPAMLFIDASFLKIFQAVMTTCIGMVSISVGLAGFMLRKVSTPWRFATIAGGFLLIHPSLLTDLLGFGIISLLVVIQIIKWKQEKVSAL